MTTTNEQKPKPDTRYAKQEVPQGDFAAGERTTPITLQAGDFASGQHMLPTSPAVGDFASGTHAVPTPPTSIDRPESPGITADGSPLYRTPILVAFGDIPHPICEFHIIKN